MDKIEAPIRPQDKGPAVVNLQQAMLFIVEKRQLTPANRTLASWKDSLSGEIANQLFGQGTLQLLLALLPALHLPGANFVTPDVADALNKVLQDLGAFAPVPPPFRPVVKWEYKVYSWKQPSGVLFRGAGAIPDRRNRRRVGQAWQ